MPTRKKILIILAFVFGALILGALFVIRQKIGAPNLNQPTTPVQTFDQVVSNDTSTEFNKNLYKLDEPGSPWWVVNKIRPLPAGYVPPDLAVPNVRLRLGATAEQMQYSKSATPALEEMFTAAKQEGVELVFGSGYRSETLQQQFYNQYVTQDGQAAADRYSARPGTSEHQTGLSFDATASNGSCHLEKCFADTLEGKWLVDNGYKYGFIIRYVDSKEHVTGYDYEPWHMRYVGKELAAEMHKNGIQTLEEFFGLPPAPTYSD